MIGLAIALDQLSRTPIGSPILRGTGGRCRGGERHLVTGAVLSEYIKGVQVLGIRQPRRDVIGTVVHV
jgi:hypothetical protein